MDPEFDWSAHPIFERQEPEPWSLTDMPLEVLNKGVLSGLKSDPERVRRFFAELREEFDEVRGTPMESEYARALPRFERQPARESVAGILRGHRRDAGRPRGDAYPHVAPGRPRGRAGGLRRRDREPGLRRLSAVQRTLCGSTDWSLPLVSAPGLAPGASTTVEFQPWTATFGAHRVRATADALRQIAEPNEHDNHLQRRVVVTKKSRGLPDLVPVDLSLVPCDPREDQPASFFARVHNRGGNALDAFAVRFDVDGVSLGEIVVAGLPAGKTVNVRSPRWTAVGRRHTVTVFVDALAAVSESDEANNTEAEKFEVRSEHKHHH